MNIVTNDELSTSEELQAHERFLELINRGGLFTPSDQTFSATTELYKLHRHIFSDSRLKDILLSSPNPCEVFVIASSEAISIEQLEVTCENGHNFAKTFLPKFGRKMFNLCTSNYVRDLNSAIHETKKRTLQSKSCQASRKIQKLQSQ